MATLEERLAKLREAAQSEGPTKTLEQRLWAVRQAASRPKTLQERAQDTFGFKDYRQRGTILPIGETESGELELAWPQVAVDMATSALLPGHAMEGGAYTPQDTTRFALDYAVPATMGRAPGTTTRPVTKESLIDDAPTTQDLKTRAVAAKELADQSGMVVNQAAQNRFINSLVKIAEKEEVTPGLHKPIITVLKRMAKKLGKQPNVEQLIRQRQLLQDAASAGTDADKRIARRMMNAFDDFVDGLKTDDLVTGTSGEVSQHLRDFRHLWARAKRSETIEDIIERANLAPGGLEAGLRNEFRSLLKNQRRIRGFSKEEKAMIQEIVEGNNTNLLKFLGRFSLGARGNNALGAIIGAAGGMATAGPAGMVGAPILSQLAARGAESAALQNAELVRALVAQGGRAPGSRRIKNLVEGLLTKSPGPVVGTGFEGPGLLVQPYNPDIL